MVVSRIKGKKRDLGYDVQRTRYVDMVEAGIVDPAKAVRLALQCASSAASTLLTAEAGVKVKQQHTEQ